MAEPVPDAHYLALEKQWLNRRVNVYIHPHGRVRGIVKGLSNNQAEAEDNGSATYGSDGGLLVEVPELGPNSMYGEWPVPILRAELED